MQIPKVGRAHGRRWDYGSGDGSRGEREKRIIIFRGETLQKCASPHDDSRPIAVTKTRHQVLTAERALLVGVGWKRAPRFPGMPAGEQGRESLLELVELARIAGAEIDRKSTRLN